MENSRSFVVSDIWGGDPTELKFPVPETKGSHQIDCSYLLDSGIKSGENNLNYEFGGFMKKEKTLDLFSLGPKIEVSKDKETVRSHQQPLMAPTPLWMIVVFFIFKSGFKEKWLAYTRHTLKSVTAQLYNANHEPLPILNHLELLNLLGRLGYVSGWSLRISEMTMTFPLLHCLVVQFAVNRVLLQFRAK